MQFLIVGMFQGFHYSRFTLSNWFSVSWPLALSTDCGSIIMVYTQLFDEYRYLQAV